MKTDVRVVAGEKKNQFKVLLNFIQFGTVYHSEVLAESEAAKLRNKQ